MIAEFCQVFKLPVIHFSSIAGQTLSCQFVSHCPNHSINNYDTVPVTCVALLRHLITGSCHLIETINIYASWFSNSFPKSIFDVDYVLVVTRLECDL